MIAWDKQQFQDSGFEYEESLVETTHFLNYQGNILKYQIIIDEENDQVSVSGDTSCPFSSESLYEIYAKCVLIKYESESEVKYRRFRFLFYNSSKTTPENLRLTIAGRKSDKELVVWPYEKGVNQAC